jgi:hypothetical protein
MRPASRRRTKFSACVARAKVMLPGITISFKLAPGVALGQAIAQVPDMGAAGTTGHDHDGFLQATGPMSDPANYAARPANGRRAAAPCQSKLSSSRNPFGQRSVDPTRALSRPGPLLRSPPVARDERSRSTSGILAFVGTSSRSSCG